MGCAVKPFYFSISGNVIILKIKMRQAISVCVPTLERENEGDAGARDPGKKGAE